MAEGSEKQKLIAVVEDDPYLTGLFDDLFRSLGKWRLQFFTDGQSARDCLPDLGADLILLDVRLPNLDGASLYKILRGHHNTRQTPIIVITGSYDWELRRMGLQAGPLLRKPFEMRELIAMIGGLLPEEKEG